MIYGRQPRLPIVNYEYGIVSTNRILRHATAIRSLLEWRST